MTARPHRRNQQRGIAAVVVVILLVTGVLFILAQTMGLIGTRSRDTSQQLDSAAALFAAETGLQRAQAIVGIASANGTLSAADCTGVANGTTNAVGSRGSFTYGTITPFPANCAAGACTQCTVQVTGTVGSASRTLSRRFDFGTVNGTTGRGSIVTMVLRNNLAQPAVALFNMAWKRQSQGGQATSTSQTSCTSSSGGACRLLWSLESSSGNPSVGALGTSVSVASGTLTQVVSQVISQDRDYVEVGALFPGVSGAPTLMSSFWRAPQGQVKGTSDTNSGSGSVNNGVATSGTCGTSPDPSSSWGSSSGNAQSCTNWCRGDTGADTLVFGISGRSSNVAGEITAVSFNTTSSVPVTMTRTVHFPNTDGSIANASGQIYSEVWYTYNPPYLYTGAAGSVGATSYPVAVRGTVGVQLVNVSVAASTTTMALTSANFPDTTSLVCPGDVLTRVGNPDRFNNNTAVQTTPAGAACSRAAGNYTFSPATSNQSMTGVTVQAASNQLVVTASHGTVNTAVGQTLTAAASGIAYATLSGGPAVYTLGSMSPRLYLASGMYTQGTPSTTTVFTPGGTVAPTAGTLIAAVGGTGVFAEGTRVAASPAPTATSFDVTLSPTTSISGDTICGGTCGFFKTPNSLTSTTEFTITRSNTTQWSGGFMCLSGVSQPSIIPVTSSTSSVRTWREVVQ